MLYLFQIMCVAHVASTTSTINPKAVRHTSPAAITACSDYCLEPWRPHPHCSPEAQTRTHSPHSHVPSMARKFARCTSASESLRTMLAGQCGTVVRVRRYVQKWRSY